MAACCRSPACAPLPSQTCRLALRAQDPGRFVEPDPDMARTLLDQRDSGKALLLITNSDFQCARWWSEGWGRAFGCALHGPGGRREVGSGGWCGSRFGRFPRSPTPAPPHQVHVEADGVCLRPLHAPGHDVEGPVRHGHRDGSQAGSSGLSRGWLRAGGDWSRALRRCARSSERGGPEAHPFNRPPFLSQDFFSYTMSLYEVVTEDGLMRPVLAAKRGGLYCGGRRERGARRYGHTGLGNVPAWRSSCLCVVCVACAYCATAWSGRGVVL